MAKGLTHIRYQVSDRDRVCRLCGDKIAWHTWAVMFAQVHVSPKVVDLFFHEGCFERSLQWAKETRNNTNQGDASCAHHSTAL